MDRFIMILIFLSLCGLAATAQTGEDLKNSTWVRIMQNDTSVNYFTAKKDFTKFVAEYRMKEAQRDKEKRSTENDERLPNEEHLKSPEESAIISFQLWSKSIRPFVTADGKVMSLEQRMAIVNRRK